MRKRWRWFRRIAAAMAVVALVLLGAAIVMVVRWRHIPLGATTTRITAPLAADGFPDYLKALNDDASAGVTAANNAAPAVLAVTGLRADAPALWKATELRLLGMSDPGAGKLEAYSGWLAKQPDVAATRPYISPREQADEDDEVRQASQALWSRADRPELAAYLDSQAAALDELDAALARNRFYVPTVTTDGQAETLSRPALANLEFGSGGKVRYAAQTFAARAMLRLNGGDSVGYGRDTAAELKLSRLLVQQPTMIEYLIALSVRARALETVQIAATSPKLDAATARALEREMASAGAWPSPAGAIDEAERYEYLDMMCGLAAGRTTGAGGATGTPSFLPINLPEGMREGNAFYDRLRDAYGAPSYADQQRATAAAERDASAFSRGGLLYKMTHTHEIFIAIMMPSLTRAGTLYTTTLATERVARAALALRIYQKEHDGFPETLAAASLAPGDQADPFTGKPLLYRRDGTGYVLYSVGEDLSDDGGKERGTSNWRTGYDLVVRAKE